LSDAQTEISLSDPQFEFLTSEKKHTGFVAGFGSGKSFIGTLKTLLKVIDTNIPKVAYYLPTYGDIRDIAFDGFPTVCEMLGYKYKLNKSDKEFTIFNANGTVKGIVMFRNMSEPESIVGYQVGYSLIDETDILKQEIMDKAFKKILGRNRLIVPVEDEEIIAEYALNEVVPNGVYFHKSRKILCYINSIDVAGTPEGFKWFYTRFVKNSTDKDLLIKASTYSNMENLPDDFIETLAEQYPPELFEAYVKGEFVNIASGVVYSYFNRKTHHTDNEIEPKENLFIGQDFNVGGCCGRVVVIRKGKPMLLDEYCVNDTESIITHLKNAYSGHRIVITPDASSDSNKTNSSKTDLQLLKDAGFMIDAPKANPRIKNRVNTVNNMFYRNELLVNTNKCPKSTEALEQQAYDKNGDPEKFAGADTVDDSNDALGYIIYRKFGIDKQKAKTVSRRSVL